MEDTLISLYCVVDQFCKEFYPQWEKHLITQGLKKRRTPSRLSPSEIIADSTNKCNHPIFFEIAYF